MAEFTRLGEVEHNHMLGIAGPDEPDLEAPPADSALMSASAELWLSPNWSVTGKFDGEFANGAQTYAGTGTVRYRW